MRFDSPFVMSNPPSVPKNHLAAPQPDLEPLLQAVRGQEIPKRFTVLHKGCLKVGRVG
ncbi:MAG TPA: hypothetical protein PKL14_08630 [Holophaga sp.]|nr:hypothetical protein [Holophaga sp.]